MSFMVTSPVSCPDLSVTKIFSILLLYISFLTSSWDVPSTTVISLSFGVMIEETSASMSSAYLKSLPVTIPFNSSSSTTGIPEIFNSSVNCFNSPMVLVDLMVEGSLTTPLSCFLTALTCMH